MRVYGLRVENKKNPIDISVKQPSFSWKVETDEENWRQKSYRVRVWKEGETVWDSGWKESAQMNQVLYEGKELESDSDYFWQADCISRSGEIASGSREVFGTGIFEPEDWQGCYIGETKDHEYHLFRKTFQIEKKIQRARLFVCGLGHHEVYINNEKISDRVLEPGWSDYRKTCFYSVYDVTGFLKTGKNGIGIKPGDGMFNVPGDAAGGRYVYYERSYGKCKLNVQLNLTFTDGSRDSLVTDETWSMRRSPVLYCCIYGGEIFDGRLMPDGFSGSDYREEQEEAPAWKPAVRVEPPMGRLCTSPVPPMKVMERYTPVSVQETSPGVYLYDLGTNFSGWVKIRLLTDGKMAGRKVVLTPGEILGKDKKPDQRATGHDYRWEYILNDQKEQVFAPDFTYTGFRYVQVEGIVPGFPVLNEERLKEYSADRLKKAPAGSGNQPDGSKKPSGVPEDQAELSAGKPVLASLEGEFIYPEVETTGSFSCSNQLFNDIHKIINQAVKSNMKSYFTDCPHREKLPWLEETHLIGPAIMYNYDVENLYVKQEQDMADSQRENGLVPDICPEYVIFGYHEGFVDSPEWGSACIINPWYLYLRYGNTALLKKYYPVMERYIRYLTSRTHHKVLHHGLGDWLDIGPCTPCSQNTPVPVVATAVYYYDLGIMEKVSALLGKEKEEAEYRRLREEVFEEYNLQFLDDQTGRYANGSQTAQAISLVAGLVPEKYREKVLEQLKKDVTRRGFAITAGDVGHPFLIAALMENGMSDILNEMTNITKTPGYGYQVVNGATTLTEEWDGPDPERPHGSQNHLMLGSIEEWFYAGLAGLASIRCGLPFDQVRIRPHIAAGINYCSASMMHPYGKLSVSWHRKGKQALVKTEIPPNLTAFLESEDGSVRRKVGSGSYTWIVPADSDK